LQIDSISAAGFRWLVHREHRPDLADLIREPAGFLDRTESRVIKSNNVRTVLHLRMGAHEYYLKRYERGGLIEQVKALLMESKAAREWRIMKAGLAAGLPVPIPAAMAEKRRGGKLLGSYLATVAIPDVLDLVTHLEAHLLEDRPARHAFLRALGGLVSRFHAAGLFHRDLHSGNVLVQQGKGIPGIHFIDLHRGRVCRCIPRRARRWNLAFLLHSTSRVTTPEDRVAVVRGYQGSRGFPGGGEGRLGNEAEALAWIEGMILRLERRRLKSRSRRCVKRSSDFRVERIQEGTLHVRRAFGGAAALAAVAAHREERDAGRTLKRTKRTVLTRVTVEQDVRLVVKEYFGGGLDRVHGGRGMAAWRAGNGLGVRGVSGVRPLAYLRSRGGGGFLVMEEAPGERLDHHVIRLAREHGERSREFSAEIVRVGRAVADLFRGLHERGVYHSDMKACNLFVDPLADRDNLLTVIDYDRVRFPDRAVNERRCIKNLAQMHASVPTHVSGRIRVRWFRWYANEETWRNRRRWFDGIRRECSSKIVVDREPIE